MKALSIKQPWAWLICAGFPLSETYDNPNGSQSVRFSGKVILKDVENRDWSTNFRGRIYVHAAKRMDGDAWQWLADKGFALATSLSLCSPMIPRGAIIGEVDIIDCVTESRSPWFTGPYGFVLAHPVLYDKAIPYKGSLRFFEVPLLKR